MAMPYAKKGVFVLWMVVYMCGVSTLRSEATYRRTLCNTWRFNVEVNNVQGWEVVPNICEAYVKAYMTSNAYRNDFKMAILQAISFANSSLHDAFTSSHRHAWVLDIDETSLSNLPLYAHHHFGVEAYNDTQFNEWVEKKAAPVLPPTLRLFNTLKRLGFHVFFLTGRTEAQRNATTANLLKAGYRGWKGLILRQNKDHGVAAIVYKSMKRKALEDEGYTIVGNVGDQWSDLRGLSTGSRVFKLPDPMYYIA